MDNKYTRKEEKCLLCNGYCDNESRNCDECISREEEYQREQCRIECMK